MTLRFKIESKGHATRWRLNTSQLQNENSCQYIRQQILDYWEINDGTVDDPGVVWDAFKAYLRGRLIQHSSFLKKQASDQIFKLETEIKDLEREYADRGDQNSLANLRKAGFSLFRCRQKYYEQGERAGKLLAQRVKQQQAKTLISAIQNEKGEILTDTMEINNTFPLLYQKLYTSQDSWDSSEFQNFLSGTTLPTLSELARKRMGACITLGEVQRAIKCLSAGRSPGGDGFPTDFYRSFSDLLAPRLLTVFQDAFQRGSLPESMQNAIITLIHKKGKDPQHCGSYRLVSLINVDAKILAKILALRLEVCLPTLIHPDQVGFVKGRSSADNLRRLLHLVWQKKNSMEPIVAFSLDAEKAFDRVEWEYLFVILERFDVREVYIKWVKLLYGSPKAAVLTNGNISNPFRLSRGTRQGCPLSPLIFSLALEPLASAIRNHVDIKGIASGQEEHKLLLYADDILLLSSNPETAVPHILSMICSFSLI